MDYLCRFLAGGILVSLFAVLGDSFQPKTFSGLFGAAPSVAIAGLFLTAWQKGEGEMQMQSYAMIFGAVAMLIYSLTCFWIVKKTRVPSWLGTGLAWSVWVFVALGLYRTVIL